MNESKIEYNVNDYPYVSAQLYRPKRSKWYIQYHVYDLGLGELVKKRFFKFSGKSEAELERKASIHIIEINRLLKNGYVLKSDYGDEDGSKKNYERRISNRRAFEKAMKLKLESVGPRSKQNYRNYYNIFSAWLESSGRGGRPIKMFSQNDLVEFRTYLYEVRENSNRTRNNYIEHIKALLNVMVEAGMIHKNPASGMKKLKVKSSQNIPFLPEQKDRLENYLKKANLRLYYFTRFIYHGFMRPVEICRLRINHIDLDRGIILVRSSEAKNAKQMPVVITKPLAEDIKAMKLKGLPGNHYLFGKGLECHPDPIYRNRVSEMHRKALQATELANGELTLYSWKHTGNVNAYLAGVDIKSIQSQNRHHSLEMTEVYLRSLGLRVAKDLKEKGW
ncbi:MAG: tyrosine-type recombinase/integrase [Bacteroidota bacterium]